METILYISFNQDGSCFCLGTNEGFLVYNTSPLKILTDKNDLKEGIKIIEMLKKTNILALVGEGYSEKKECEYPNDKLIIWDDSQNKNISEIKLSAEILNVKIKTDIIIASTIDNYLYIIELSSLDIKNIFNIYENSKGLFAISLDDKTLVLAFPYEHCGYVKIKNFNNKINVPHINAHDTNISYLSLNNEGNLLATSSQRGTLIRIFCTFNGELIQELRRGAKSSIIHYITFDLKNTFLACSSSNKTVHIFSIYSSIKYLKQKGIVSKIKSDDSNSDKKEELINEPKNQKSFIGSIINVLKIGISYFESEWSFAQFRLPKNENEKAIISFNLIDNYINVLTYSGNLYMASFEPKSGGECDKINEANLFLLNKKNK